MRSASAPSAILGTRGSPLALAQANLVAKLLAEAHGLEARDFPLEIIVTTGDATQDRALSEIGGKGLFTKEIDLAQLSGRVDLAVHSAKDLPTVLPEGLVIAGYLLREDPRDALIAHDTKGFHALPEGARIGTISLRRRAMLLRARPDLDIVALRGNVATRIAQVHSGHCAGVVLAMAGLNRLGLAAEATEALDPRIFVPAVGQGAIAIVARANDRKSLVAAEKIIDVPTGEALAAERAFLKVLDGSCRTPIGGHAFREGASLRFSGIVLAPDGTIEHRVEGAAPPQDAERLGRALGEAARSAWEPWRSRE